ncbi:hypothetical protein SS50377_25992 [Spironucleus salmonicida]|uniref:Uncharacterized protein n=1 Tax=Spironucleus salmonicida TaxID=348837 RepID=V6LFF5_9EUKA|nr:hypothetical protein SS50377_25992 [Spironucleus salmonicida]|eukprot:EST43222.1 Hypothetical protein SS50377_17086 [Spironucleus salmonicida]
MLALLACTKINYKLTPTLLRLTLSNVECGFPYNALGSIQLFYDKNEMFHQGFIVQDSNVLEFVCDTAECQEIFDEFYNKSSTLEIILDIAGTIQEQQLSLNDHTNFMFDVMVASVAFLSIFTLLMVVLGVVYCMEKKKKLRYGYREIRG